MMNKVYWEGVPLYMSVLQGALESLEPVIIFDKEHRSDPEILIGANRIRITVGGWRLSIHSMENQGLLSLSFALRPSGPTSVNELLESILVSTINLPVEVIAGYPVDCVYQECQEVLLLQGFVKEMTKGG